MTEVSQESIERAWNAGYEAYATTGDMRLLEGLLPPPPARILDVPCGFGRLVTRLGASGYTVIGMDISVQAAVATLARPHGLAIRADMAAVPVRQGSFDAVLCMGNSIGFLDDEACVEFFGTVSTVLRPGGSFVLQCGHRDSYVRADVQPSRSEDDNGTIRVHTETFDVVGGRRTIVNRYQQRHGEEFVDETVIRLYTATELDTLLRRGGLVPSDWFGGHDLEPLATDSALLVVVAQRR